MAQYIQDVFDHTVDALFAPYKGKLLINTDELIQCQRLIAADKVMTCMVSVIADFRSGRDAKELGQEIAEHG